MNERQPASLTGSLLARKGDASPEAESHMPTDDGSLDPSPSLQGTPILPDEPDNFLTRGPDMLQRPDDEEDPTPAIGIRDAKPPRSKRAPALVLAVMLVFVLGGAAWLTVKIFSGDNSGTKVAGVEMRSPLEPAAAHTADAPVSLGPPPESQKSGSEQIAATSPDKTSSLSPPPTEPVGVLPPPAEPVEAQTPPEPKTASTAEAAPAPMATPKEQSAAVVASPAPKPKPAESVAMLQPVKPKAPAVEPIRKPAVTMASLTGSGSYRVQLSSSPDNKSAERERQRLARRFKDILGNANLEIQTAQLSNKRTVYRVKSDATYSRSAAKKVCKMMVAKKQGCFVTK